MSEISLLKHRAATLYRRVHERSNAADCGNHLLSYISPEFAADRDKLDRIMARLREIDPSFPRETG